MEAVLRLSLFGRITQGHDGKSPESFGKAQYFLHLLHAVLQRRDAQPYGPQSHGLSGKEDILGSGRYVLHPVVGYSGQCLGFITAHDDGQRGFGCHARVRIGLRQPLKHLAVSHYDKVPGAFVYRRRSRHAGTQQFFDLILFYRPVLIGAYAGARKDVVEITMPYVCHIEYAADKVVFPLGSAVAASSASPTRQIPATIYPDRARSAGRRDLALSAGNLGVPERLGVLMEGPLVMAAVGVKSWDEAVLNLDSGGHPLTEGLTFIPDYQADTSITHYFRIHQ